MWPGNGILYILSLAMLENICKKRLETRFSSLIYMNVNIKEKGDCGVFSRELRGTFWDGRFILVRPQRIMDNLVVVKDVFDV